MKPPLHQRYHPQNGLSSEMDEGEIVPSELFSALGLLIVESRVPHLSSKGHVEGPHIPSTSSYLPSKHVCSSSTFLCSRMEGLRRQMQVLWKNHIPMCIEVLLFPDCEHGGQLAGMQDVTLPSSRDSSVLLEQWTVQVLPRRGGESVARARELFQAMKSYLHFSQLSAWLNLTHGKAPRNVSYRVSPPAEFCTSTFQEPPEWHTFPTCTITKTSVIKVTVGTLPRRSNIIHVPCKELHPLGQFVRTTSSGASVVTAKASCRPQQTLHPPQEDVSHYRNRSSHGRGSGKNRKYSLQDQKGGFDQSLGREGEKQQPPAASGSGNHPYPKKLPQGYHSDLQEPNLQGESRGRGRESPGVPTHLDFTKIRHTPQPFGNFQHFVVMPPGLCDLKPDRSSQMPPFPYPHPLCPPQQPQHHQHQNQHHPLQPQPYLDPSLIACHKRSPLVPRMNHHPSQHHDHQYPYHHPPHQPYNAFFFDQPRLYPQTPEDMPSYHPMQYLGAIPKQTSFLHHKSPPDIQPVRDLFPHNPPFHVDQGNFFNQPDVEHQKSLKAESPKVLFSKKSPGQAFYARDDPRWVASVTSQESEGSDGSSPEIDKFLKSMSTSVQPLSPQEIQNYLSRLSSHHNRSRKDKDISPLSCKSFTEKDFVEAETSHHSDDLNRTQQLPTKFAKALEEANKDLQLSTRTIRTSTCSHDERKHEDKLSEERSVTPTPSEFHSEELKQNQGKSTSPKQSPSAVMKGCKLQNSSQPVCISSTKKASSELRTDSSVGHVSPGQPTQSPKDEGQELLPKTVAVQSIPKAMRPMSPLTKQLLNTSPEIKTPSNSILNNKSIVSNGAVSTSISNGVPCTNGISAKPTEIDSLEEHSTSNVQNGVSLKGSQENGHIPCSHENLEQDHSSVIVTPEDNQNNNAKPKVASSSECEEGKNAKSNVPPSTLDIATSKDDEKNALGKAAGHKKATPLLHSLFKRDLSEQIKSQDDNKRVSTRAVPTPQERASFRRSLDNSTNMIFHAATGLPLQSSPAPIKKRTSACFDYDSTLTDIRAIKNSLSCANLEEQNRSESEVGEKAQGRFYSVSAPASTNCLLGNFEESLLNGRIEPSGVVEGFTAEIGASGAFCPKHVVLPVTAFFFNLSDDNAPSPYLGHINLESLGRRGYHVPKKGTVQVTLFNPNKTVVKMFVVMYNLTHMPPNCQTFLRQRTLYMPVSGSQSDLVGEPVFLRYLIHLRFASSKSGKIYLHTDLRLIFARDKFEYDSSVASYELRSFTEGPVNPKFSPKR